MITAAVELEVDLKCPSCGEDENLDNRRDVDVKMCQACIERRREGVFKSWERCAYCGRFLPLPAGDMSAKELERLSWMDRRDAHCVDCE